MSAVIRWVALSSIFAASGASAAEVASWEAWMKTHRYACPGPFDTLKAPRTLELAGKAYVHSGYKLEVQTPDADNTIKLGVVSAIKDVAPHTQRNLEAAFAWFREQGVEWVIANGDLALDELDLEEVVAKLGEGGLPTLLVIGNSESRGSWARVLKDAAPKYPNLINGVWIRQVVADDVELWTMPGYHDKRFVHQGAGCTYGKADVDAALEALRPSGKGPVMLVAHGPPLGKGTRALDWILEKKNVGDPELTRLIQKAAIPFGIFGHILEAGGAAVGGDLATPVASGRATSRLYLNAGSLSGDPWAMNDGSTAYGMAFIVTIAGERARYEVKKMPPPPLE